MEFDIEVQNLLFPSGCSPACKKPLAGDDIREEEVKKVLEDIKKPPST